MKGCTALSVGRKAINWKSKADRWPLLIYVICKKGEEKKIKLFYEANEWWERKICGTREKISATEVIALLARQSGYPSKEESSSTNWEISIYILSLRNTSLRTSRHCSKQMSNHWGRAVCWWRWFIGFFCLKAI